MISRRILSSIATAAVCLSVMQPAFAATASSDDVLATFKAFDPNAICAGRTGRNLGKCIGDVVKRISAIRNDFNQALRVERDAWYAEHGVLGESADYRAALVQYLAIVKTKRDAFVAIQHDLEVNFFNARKDVLDSGLSGETGTTNTPPSLPVTSSDVSSMTSTCAKQADSRALRVCMRVQLRMRNTPALNISGSGARTIH